MRIVRIESGQVITKAGIHFQPAETVVCLLIRSPARYTSPTVAEQRGEGQMSYILPGEQLTVEPAEEYALIDYVEFSMTPEESTFFHSLEHPVGLNTPANFFNLTTVIKNMHYLFYSSDRYRMEKMELFLKQLFYTTASGEDSEDSSKKQVYRRMCHLQRMISDDPHAFHDVKEAAAHVGVSEDWFIHLYREYFNISFTQNIIRCKITRACDLLHSTDWTIAHIATELGYTNDSFFYRQFKQQMGLSPSKYRQLKYSLM